MIRTALVHPAGVAAADRLDQLVDAVAQDSRAFDIEIVGEALQFGRLRQRAEVAPCLVGVAEQTLRPVQLLAELRRMRIAHRPVEAEARPRHRRPRAPKRDHRCKVDLVCLALRPVALRHAEDAERARRDQQHAKESDRRRDPGIDGQALHIVWSLAVCLFSPINRSPFVPYIKHISLYGTSGECKAKKMSRPLLIRRALRGRDNGSTVRDHPGACI
jgi:hypothetical protein